MENFKKSLKLLIDDEIKSHNDIKNNMDNLKSLKKILDESFDFKIKKLKEQYLKDTLGNYLEKSTKESCEIEKIFIDRTDNNYTLEKKYNLSLEVNEIYMNAMSKMNIDYDNIYNGEIPKNLPKEFEYIFKKCNGYENDTFYVRPYNYYGLELSDCSCGLEDYIDKKYYELSKEEFEKFEKEQQDKNFHAKECARHDIGFYYKPTNLKIGFIKRPLYEVVCNQEINKDILEAVLMDCVNSYNKDFKNKKEVKI